MNMIVLNTLSKFLAQVFNSLLLNINKLTEIPLFRALEPYLVLY